MILVNEVGCLTESEAIDLEPEKEFLALDPNSMI